MRVAIIGARRVRQGLGPFLARFVAEAGHDVAAVVGTRPETAVEAATDIETATGQSPRATTELDGVLEAGCDAMIIASPHATHGAWLEKAVLHGLHVLCEKPLVWGHANAGAEADRRASLFVQQGLVLRVNTQWPLTLDTFRELHPAAPACPARFFMQMPPRQRGLASLLDCLSHPLSMLAHLAIPADADAKRRRLVTMDGIEALRFEAGGPDTGRWELRFRYVSGEGAIDTHLVFDSTADPERRTTYALDDHQATRVVEPSTYAMTLEDQGRSIPLPDPTRRLVRSFLDACQAGLQPMDMAWDPAARPGVRHLEQIMTAAAEQYGASLP